VDRRASSRARRSSPGVGLERGAGRQVHAVALQESTQGLGMGGVAQPDQGCAVQLADTLVAQAQAGVELAITAEWSIRGGLLALQTVVSAVEYTARRSPGAKVVASGAAGGAASAAGPPLRPERQDQRSGGQGAAVPREA